MAVTYRFLTAEQQRTSAEQEAFSAEHNHYRATIRLAAAPADTALQAEVSSLEALVAAAHVKYDEALVAEQAAEPIVG